MPEANPVQLMKNPNVKLETQSNLHDHETGNMPPVDPTSENKFRRRPDQGETNNKPGKRTSIKDSSANA